MRYARRAALAAAALAAATAVPALAGSSPAHRAGPVDTYRAYDLGLTGGEPSIGFDPRRDRALYASGMTVLRLAWNATGRLTSANVTPAQSLTTLDTILVTDQHTGRTYLSYLLGACSQMFFSDNAGASWQNSTGCGPGALLDHESVGAGPFHAPLPANPLSPDAVYYCAQNGFNGACAVSVDGGRTFGPGVPVANTPANDPGNPEGGACSALHGHVRVGPDGTAYLPLKGCHGQPTSNNLTNSEYYGGQTAVSVSTNDGASWTIHPVPGSHNPDESDPSVGIGPRGSVYLGWEDGTNPSDVVNGLTSSARIAVSHDGGKSWTKPYDVSSALGVRNVQFPEVITGDDNRAAFAFIGTTAAGDDQNQSFQGAWDLYVATTYDGGRSWSTVDVTPHDPVQRGCVDLQGLAPGSQRANPCTRRDLLDFNDITVDAQGRVLVAYTDGCTGACVTDPSDPQMSDAEMVLRQTGGRGLYAADDGRVFAPPRR